MSEELLDVERLHRITNEMITAITSPPFVEAMRRMKATPKNERLRIGAEILTPDALRAQGVPLPTDMRVTSRYFEAGAPDIEVGDSFARTVPDSIPALRSANGSGGCCCGGGASVCGGCGG